MPGPGGGRQLSAQLPEPRGRRAAAAARGVVGRADELRHRELCVCETPASVTTAHGRAAGETRPPVLMLLCGLVCGATGLYRWSVPLVCTAGLYCWSVPLVCAAGLYF